jgi:hypothetical protein
MQLRDRKRRFNWLIYIVPELEVSLNLTVFIMWAVKTSSIDERMRRMELLTD